MTGVLVAMSGGVDSAVAAALLSSSGARVVGVTFRQWADADFGPAPEVGPCCDLSSIDAARKAADHIGVSHVVLDAGDVFVRCVVDHFVDSYLRGETPNPCVRCNAMVRLPRLAEKAKALGLSHVATGHYARVEDGRLLRGVDRAKDQSYALHAVPRELLSALVLPVGSLTKAEVRETARRLGLPNSERAESQDVCFVAGDRVEFVRERVRMNPTRFPDGRALEPGTFVSEEGLVLGEHAGTARFTIGQRRVGVGIGKRAYVARIDAREGRVVLGAERELYSRRFTVRDVSWVSRDAPGGDVEATVMVRYRGPESRCVVRPLTDGRVDVIVNDPVRAATPGQSAVFYEGEVCLGGGVIDEVSRDVR